MDRDANQRDLCNAKRRLRRNINSAHGALASFDSPTGTLYDLADYEVFSERAQRAAGEINRCEALDRVFATTVVGVT